MLDVTAMREALAIGLARERAERDACLDGLAIFAGVLVVVVRAGAGVTIATHTIAFEGRRW